MSTAVQTRASPAPAPPIGLSPAPQIQPFSLNGARAREGGAARCYVVVAQKAFFIVLSSYLLLPLLLAKQNLPALVDVATLLAIHIGVFFVYLYRVAFLSLDADWYSSGARVLALAAMVWLMKLTAARFEGEVDIQYLALQMLALSGMHLLLLALLMVRVEERPSGFARDSAAKSYFSAQGVWGF